MGCSSGAEKSSVAHLVQLPIGSVVRTQTGMQCVQACVGAWECQRLMVFRFLTSGRFLSTVSGAAAAAEVPGAGLDAGEQPGEPGGPDGQIPPDAEPAHPGAHDAAGTFDKFVPQSVSIQF